MKYLLALFLLMSACAPKSETSIQSPVATPISDTKQLTCADYAGLYENKLFFGETLTINGDCTFTDSICGYNASFTLPVKNETALTVNNTNGTPGCMSNSTHSCVLSYNGDDLAVVCTDLIQNKEHTMSFDKR